MTGSELAVALAAVERAAAAVMRVYATEFGVDYKDQDGGRTDPVTEADREANAILVQALHDAFPDDAVVAEESAVPAGFATARRCWFVDPLDGTREFVAKNGEFCVMVGLAVDGRARLGVVAVPALEGGYVLAGEVGKGAVRIDAAGQRSVRVSALADPAQATIVVSRSRRPPVLDRILAELGGPREVLCGSVGVKIAKLVGGGADAYLHPPMHDGGGAMRWDACAPDAIVTAAGGVFTDARGALIDYASADLALRGGMMASNGALHSRLVEALVRASAPLP